MKDMLTAKIDGINLTATHFKAETRSKKTLLFCLPGGGITAEYFNLDPSYSFAKHMTARGYDLITMDHPGTATNPLPENHPFLPPRMSADYIVAAAAQWTQHDRVIGVGHSMGGTIATLAQAKHKAFHAIGLFGSSAGGLDWGLSETEKNYIEDPETFARDLEKLTLAKFGAEFIKTSSGPSGKSITFSGENPDLTQRLRDISCELYAAGGMMSMTRGSFRKEVEAIDVPMFIAFGDHDIGIPPKDVPRDYVNAPNIELVTLRDTGHNHFAFSSINQLCDQFDHWASSLV